MRPPPIRDTICPVVLRLRSSTLDRLLLLNEAREGSGGHSATRAAQMGSQRLRRRWGNTTTPTSRAQAPTARLIAARIALLNTSSALRGSGGAQTQTVTSLASNATAPPISLSIGTLILLASRRGKALGR